MSEAHSAPTANEPSTLRRLVGPLYDFVLHPLGALVRGAVEAATGERWAGSDTFAAYTARYTWIANQFGHSTIGLFFGVLSWVLAVVIWGDGEAPAPWVPATIITLVLCVFYGAKEAADFMTEIEQAPVPRPFFEHPGLRERYLDEIAVDAVADALFVVSGALMGWAAGYTIFASGGDAAAEWLLLAFTVLWAALAYVFGRIYLPFMSRRDRAGFRAYGRLARLQEKFVWRSGGAPVDLSQGINTLTERAVNASGGGSAPECLMIVGSPGARAVTFVNAIAGDALWKGAEAIYLDRNRADMGNRPAEKRAEIAKAVGLVCLDDFVDWHDFQPDLAGRLRDCVVIATAAPDRETRVAQALKDRGVAVSSIIRLTHLDEEREGASASGQHAPKA